MKKFFLSIVMVSTVLGASAKKAKQPAPLAFDAQKGVAGSVTMPQGDVVNYTAYEHLYYVTNVEDTAYQYLNIYVPEGATQGSPILLRTYVGGYMASKAARPQANDASGRALKEGFVVVIPGTRGRNAIVSTPKGDIYTGRAPKAILDLKAAIRYLRLFDKEIPGDAERIVTDGTSAGGAMSALMGATGNNPAYSQLLKAMGAADQRDDVYASVCFCPITDLEHADMAYEWLYNCTNNVNRPVSDAQASVSGELAAMFPDYQNSLNLKKSDGTPLTGDNYLDYIKQLIISSAQLAKNAGADIPDTIGFQFSSAAMPMGMMPPINGGVNLGQANGGQLSAGKQRGGGMKKQQGEYIVDLDMTKYLNYVVTTQALKTPPAFDAKGVAGGSSSGENDEFGDEKGSSVNFTDYSAAKNGATVSAEVRQNAYLLNPMNFIGTDNTDVAPHWYIRHGARDRDTAFPVPINLATKLQNSGKDVDFKLPWNRGHSGDYALDEMFAWIKSIL